MTEVTVAAAKVGVPVAVPSQAALAAAQLPDDGVEKADPVDLEGRSSSLGATAPLVGTMAFSDADLGWVVDWRFAWHGIVHRTGEAGTVEEIVMHLATL